MITPISFLTSLLQMGNLWIKMAFWRSFWKFAIFWMETTWFISETVSDRAKWSLFSVPVGLLRNNNFWKYRFWVLWPLKVTWPQKCELAIISATVRDRAKQRNFWNPVDLLLMKLQLLKISILGHMILQGHMTSET